MQILILFFLISNSLTKSDEVRIDMREYSKTHAEEMKRDAQLLHKLNLAMPGTDDYIKIMNELFYNQIGEGSIVNNQLTVIVPKSVKIGKGVTIMNGALLMGAGTITIEDKVMIAGHAKIISNNHDPYDREVLLCKPVVIKKGAWIGAGATILPGVTIGKYAIVGGDAVVTKDVPPFSVVVGAPAKVIKVLDETKFPD